jgi:hypothetical protein
MDDAESEAEELAMINRSIIGPRFSTKHLDCGMLQLM